MYYIRTIPDSVLKKNGFYGFRLNKAGFMFKTAVHRTTKFSTACSLAAVGVGEIINVRNLS
jgi:hypothetical protein